MARLDVAKKYEFASKEGLATNRSPTILIYYEGHYYPYDHTLAEPKYILSYINRLLHPLVNLKTAQDVENFLDLNKEYPENTKFMNNQWDHFQLGKDYKSEIYKTRVIAFIFNSDDFDEEI